VRKKKRASYSRPPLPQHSPLPLAPPPQQARSRRHPPHKDRLDAFHRDMALSLLLSLVPPRRACPSSSSLIFASRDEQGTRRGRCSASRHPTDTSESESACLERPFASSLPVSPFFHPLAALFSSPECLRSTKRPTSRTLLP
jgi:hypothetical protein